MDPFVRKLTKFDAILAKGETWVLIALVAIMTVVVLLQVIYRYLLTQPLHGRKNWHVTFLSGFPSSELP